MMNHVERFRATMAFQPVDRLPRWEWAMWWDKTIDRWRTEGLPVNLQSVFDISQYFGLDPYQQYWFSPLQPTAEAVQHHIDGSVSDMDSYVALKPMLYPDHSEAIEALRPWAERQSRGDAVVWATFEGFYWFPRSILGVERHALAFFEQPELLHRINQDLLEFHFRTFEKLVSVCTPTFMTFGEDMSYNHGPMLGRDLFDEFLAPYYRKLIPLLEEHEIVPIVDTDGDVTEMVPWLQSVGIVGVLPLERRAGVDAVAMRSQFPDLRMIGHYDKWAMTEGEEAMRAEFERIRPLIRGGGYIPSVDHQTPPGVSMEEYRVYLRLLEEYTQVA